MLVVDDGKVPVGQITSPVDVPALATTSLLSSFRQIEARFGTGWASRTREEITDLHDQPPQSSPPASRSISDTSRSPGTQHEVIMNRLG